MNLKLVVAVSLFTALPVVAHAQNAPKPTMADVQKVVQMVGSDKTKLKAYCDLGKVQMQMQQADEKKDTKTLDALSPKADALAQQIGPEYVKLMDGLESVDPNSPEGRKFETAFETLSAQCK